MKLGKHAIEALKYSYQSAVYQFEHQEKEVERYTGYVNEWQSKLDQAEAKHLEDADRVLELRAALIKLGIDPDEDW